ncbi:MAG: formylglycine-generating enzyme family protein [Betaproteobacteria bacterium]
MTVAEIPAGTFAMGGSSGDEQPRHTVSISSFWMATTTVTQAQWQAVLGDDPSYSKGDDRPVERVSWEDAQRFIAALNAKETDRSYRLPSEAEWEYACRADTSGETYGDPDAIAWNASNSGNQTHPVGRKRPNAFGLYDMLGNVSQWCQDWYGSYPANSQTDPTGASSGTFRVNRGGSYAWRYIATIRSAFRDRATPGAREDFLGFRVVSVPNITGGD